MLLASLVAAAESARKVVEHDASFDQDGIPVDKELANMFVDSQSESGSDPGIRDESSEDISDDDDVFDDSDSDLEKKPPRKSQSEKKPPPKKKMKLSQQQDAPIPRGKKGADFKARQKSKPQKPKTKTKTKRKKFEDESSESEPSDSEESEDSEDSESYNDPTAGIDFEALTANAMKSAKVRNCKIWYGKHFILTPPASQTSPLHSLVWHRVVLDEAHYTKTRSSSTAKSCSALVAINRWCLSGTPLQNRVSEFYSLIRFLRIRPMAEYFCKGKGKDGKGTCDCKSIHYRFESGRCLGCNHTSMQHYAYFNKWVLNPTQRAGYTGDGRLALLKLKNEIMDKYMLRRTKDSKAADLQLPPREVRRRR
ncbi:hypothetical protein TL16_g05357 [Triparma laevis f. inornata]|uniref:SNF2 N-terminal domain-containing protein n=1 Tax=Triparma laevis f. inornata TaxID=1714386 RepID=A0A9W7E8W1_9STRA|nr:hypothetical protein TL16_g05357 [Triparma laevis f. inornata]